MSDDARIPSIELIRRLAEASEKLVSIWVDVTTKDNTCVPDSEESLATAIGDFGDALRPLGGLAESDFSGWHVLVGRAVVHLPEVLKSVAGIFGLEPFLAPRDERQAFRDRRLAAWNAEHGAPSFDVAMSYA